MYERENPSNKFKRRRENKTKTEKQRDDEMKTEQRFFCLDRK